jgi:CRISPR type I-E-associated protein CasB/Cse2
MTRDEEQQTFAASLSWWRSLQRSPNNKHKGDPGALTRLRRGGIDAAVFEPATVDLYQRIGPLLRGGKLHAFETAALVAAVLAHVREHDAQSVARAAGATAETKARLSPLRLRKLLAARGATECLIAFRRLVALLNKRANVGDLAISLVEWDREGVGDRRRTRWAFDYYNAPDAAPDEPRKTYEAPDAA